MVKYIAIGFFVVSTFTAYGADKGKRIENSRDLGNWCKSTTKKYYLKKNITPYNWTASWWSKGNMMFVEGEWRIGTESSSVVCYVKKGGKSKHATYEFKKNP